MKAWALRMQSHPPAWFRFRAGTEMRQPGDPVIALADSTCRLSEVLLFAREEDAAEFRRAVLGTCAHAAEEVEVP